MRTTPSRSRPCLTEPTRALTLRCKLQDDSDGAARLTSDTPSRSSPKRPGPEPLQSPALPGCGRGEPAESAFDWSHLDAEVARAKALGKKVSLSVAVGNRAPAWVYEAGVKEFKFILSQPYQKATFCKEQRIPIPFDSVFLEKWKSFIRALGQRYAGNPTVSKVRISGVNSYTAETHLPHEEGQEVCNLDKSTCCNASNDIANWIAVGYTASRIKEAWLEIGKAFLEAFSTKALSAPIYSRGLPKIDDLGNYDASSRWRRARPGIAAGAELPAGE